MILIRADAGAAVLPDLPDPPPPPGAGPRWRPAGHVGLVRAVLAAAADRGWRLSNFKHHLAAGGADLAASWDAEAAWVEPPPGAAFSVGVVNSNARHFALRLYAGLRYSKEGFGLALAEVPLGRHTAGHDPEAEVREAVRGLNLRRLAAAVARLEKAVLSERRAAEVLVTAGRRRLLPWGRLGRAELCWRHGEKTAWRLLRCLARECARNPPLRQLPQLFALYKLLDPRAD